MQKLFGRRINEKGQEVPDPTPVELPVGYKAPLPLEVRMRAMIKNEMSDFAQKQGFETWEEANDFNLPDESDDGLFTDEDELVAANDPFVERAFHEKSKEISEKYKNKQPKPQLSETPKEDK